jgi:hypothetical protein
MQFDSVQGLLQVEDCQVELFGNKILTEQGIS